MSIKKLLGILDEVIGIIHNFILLDQTGGKKVIHVMMKSYHQRVVGQTSASSQQARKRASEQALSKEGAEEQAQADRYKIELIFGTKIFR